MFLMAGLGVVGVSLLNATVGLSANNRLMCEEYAKEKGWTPPPGWKSEWE